MKSKDIVWNDLGVRALGLMGAGFVLFYLGLCVTMAFYFGASELHARPIGNAIGGLMLILGIYCLVVSWRYMRSLIGRTPDQQRPDRLLRLACWAVRIWRLTPIEESCRASNTVIISGMVSYALGAGLSSSGFFLFHIMTKPWLVACCVGGPLFLTIGLRWLDPDMSIGVLDSLVKAKEWLERRHQGKISDRGEA